MYKLIELWRFFVFIVDGIKCLVRFQFDFYKIVIDRDGIFKESYYEKFMIKFFQLLYIIVILMKCDEKKLVLEIEEIGVVFCVIQNMYLMVMVYGVGFYLSIGGIIYFEEVKEFFKLGKEDRFIGFFYLGILR